MNLRTHRALLLLVVTALMLPTHAHAARKRAADNAPESDEAKQEYKANELISKALELLAAKQEERGLKMLSSVPEMFPKTKARFRAHLEIGKFQTRKQRYDLAIRQFAYLADSEDPDEVAEGLYQTGICFYQSNSYDKAFMALRKVTNDHPWSVFANEAYYYIGQCHFKLGRWSRAIEALEMVGTSVPTDLQGQQFAEAGQRLYVKIYDKDLVILLLNNEKPAIDVTTKGGDKEKLVMDPLGRGGEYVIGSIPTAPGEVVVGDGTLQILGLDELTATYSDRNTESGKLNETIVATVKMVSTASAGFTDGAYRDYTKGVFADNEAFIRVKDLDRDTTSQPDTIRVRVHSEFKVEKEKNVEKTGVDLSEPEEEEIWQVRDSVEVVLTETGPHTGIFVGTVVPHTLAADAQAADGDPNLSVLKGDDVVLSYIDEAYVGGDEPREIKARARLLVGQIQDVKIEQRVVDSLDLRARKNLIEAKIYLRLGQIFKEVGLTNKASEKADEGLARAEDVISTSLKASLDRSLVEDAFSVKWDLLLVKDKLEEAISVCHTLTRLFPDSSLVDRALLKIGQAKLNGPHPEQSIQVFNSVIALPKSDLKAEAAFNIGLALETIALRQVSSTTHQPNLSSAILAYRRCADTYPESPFAGDSLDRIANYYINAKDYARAVELMERVFQEYPDASFLDKMLLKWVVASYRMGNFTTAREKAEQLLSEYPNSKLAEKARGFLEIINKRSGQSS